MVAKRKRNYKEEQKWQSTPEQKARRAARGRHRYKLMKTGKLKPGMEVEHKNGNAQDGSPSNLTVRPKQFQRRQGGFKTSRGVKKKNA